MQMNATQQNESPIANLMEDLGMNDTDTIQEDLNLSDSTEEPTNDGEADITVETETEKSDTEDSSEILSKLKELENFKEVTEKRLTDKDKYINELREQLNGTKKEEVEESEGEDFWDNPEGYIKKIMDTNSNLEEQLRISNLRIDEQAYARDKPEYYDIVNQKVLTEEFAKDSDFAERFMSSDKPYEVAYQHMTKAKETKKSSENALREQIKKELLKEMGVKEQKKAPVNINSMGSSSGSTNQAPVDGFASVFGG